MLSSAAGGGVGWSAEEGLDGTAIESALELQNGPSRSLELCRVRHERSRPGGHAEQDGQQLVIAEEVNVRRHNLHCGRNGETPIAQ